VKPDKARALKAVRNGVGVMPPYAGKLTPEEIEAVAAYVSEAAR
jgi:sulfite dehydrogenase